MKIAVCVSHVPDTATKIKINSEGKSIDPIGVTFVVNPYDEYAIEEALKTKEKFGGEVFAISVGGEANKETIRKALAMGADNGILLKDNNERDSFAVAKALAEEIKLIGCELVFMGKQSVDYDNSITGQLTAEMLGYSCITTVVDLEIDNQKVIAEREIEGGREVVESELPVVITAQKGLNEPRYASLKGIMAAKKKVIEEKPAFSVENVSEIIKMYSPPAKNPGRILGTDSSAVPELVRLLREEAKVI
ncbi:MAG: electron transfer flavoprotein subunit beta [Ignavibacteria bacterium RIFOXYB2_FULL_35_12]|nr:MAG: electron transfer flavoprotein subunit beta [Ignavibacteria bacterium GWA2_36_19]OGU53567.1 MAG: electron transfer flavoprotein subunit beta [Ignavibacteria bacterium GWC2_35_8]OGU60135.1 MAG: electron transfer flavoprotein subunit beta [Ignavibacteria bacterium GWF2_35_20]OGU78421.1 MAG: electron transfer flavoprotein subunit beta [Ignavibacteria bacterium RIFOXYA2_FULL_35_9]OGU88506.1 MAG: electron transfer flavoprotein subunit beta [Ignavibacteria bacterium RIFOXYC12_FULL_35_11]OGU9